MLAVGTSGSLVVQALPTEYQPIGYAVCGGLISASATILAVWHKFINTLQDATKPATQP